MLIQEIIAGIAANHVLRVSFWAWFVAQILKVPVNILIYGKLDIKRLIGSGGMPSSHSALVMALTVSVGRFVGWSTPAFAIAAVFAGVVMYDAAGVRRAAGKQAEVLNKIIEELYQGSHISPERLKELIGHSPVEVIIGGILGAFFGYYL